jgi:hypothetical protein
MICENQNPCEERVYIIQGEDKRLKVKILDENDVAVDLSLVTEIQASFDAEIYGNQVVKRLSDISDPIEIVSGTSIIEIPLRAAETELLKPARGQFFFVAIDFNNGRKITRVENRYDVLKAPNF